MNFIRTEGEAALSSLIKAARETLDHYRDATELVEEKHAQLFHDISRQRRAFILRLEDAVRASGNLPTAPDPDKEAGEMLIHHVAALIKSDYVVNVIEQRIEGEKNLADLTTEAKNSEPEAPYTNLLNEFAQHITETMTQLQTEHA